MSKDQQQAGEASAASGVSPGGMSRRKLLSGAGQAAVPAIVTLYSGAALARSSNVVSADGSPGAEGNRYRCLDTSSVYRTDKPRVYDLGQDPMAHVTRINSNRQYYRIGANNHPTGYPVSGQTMCETGGNYLRRDYSSFRRVTVRQGVLVSATALGSFANDITYTDV